MQVNLEAIRELRDGLTGPALAVHELTKCQHYVRDWGPTASPIGMANFEIGALRNTVVKLCDLLALAVEPPESLESQQAQDAVDSRSPLCSVLRASIALERQKKADAQRNLLARQNGKQLARRFDDVAPVSAFAALGGAA